MKKTGLTVTIAAVLILAMVMGMSGTVQGRSQYKGLEVSIGPNPSWEPYPNPDGDYNIVVRVYNGGALTWLCPEGWIGLDNDRWTHPLDKLGPDFGDTDNDMYVDPGETFEWYYGQVAVEKATKYEVELITGFGDGSVIKFMDSFLAASTHS